MSLHTLTGNKRIKAVLANLLHNRRIPSSMIFFGPNGSNRLGFALNFAKALLCGQEVGDCCDLCRTCAAIDKGLYPDVTVISPEGQFYKKAQIDELIAWSYLKPVQGEYKVAVMKEAHRMNESSANAFLKTLEEPTPSNVFILLTNNLSMLLPTIQSRCQIFKFAPAARNEIVAELTKTGMPEEKARLISYLTLDVDNVFDQDFTELADKRARAFEVFSKLIRRHDIEDILLDLYDRSRNRESFLIFYTELVHLISTLLRDIMVLMIDPQNETIINFDYKDKLMALSSYIRLEQVLALIRRMETLLRDVQRNLNARVLALEFIQCYTAGEDPHA